MTEPILISSTGPVALLEVAVIDGTSQRVHITIDGRDMYCSSVVVHGVCEPPSEAEPTIGPNNFTQGHRGVAFYADGEDAPCECFTLRIDNVLGCEIEDCPECDEDGAAAGEVEVEFTLCEGSDLHDGFGSLEEVARAFPQVSPTLEDWKAGRTVRFGVMLTAARQLAGYETVLAQEVEGA